MSTLKSSGIPVKSSIFKFKEGDYKCYSCHRFDCLLQCKHFVIQYRYYDQLMSNNVCSFQKRKSHRIITCFIIWTFVFYVPCVGPQFTESLNKPQLLSHTHTHTCTHACQPHARMHTRVHIHTHTHTRTHTSHLTYIHHGITRSILPEQSQSAGEVFTCSRPLPALPQSTVHQTSPSQSARSITRDPRPVNPGPSSPHENM